MRAWLTFINIVGRQVAWEAVQQAKQWRNSKRRCISVGIPAKGVQHPLASRGVELDVMHSEISARHDVTASQVHGRAPDVVGAFDVDVRDVADVDGGRLIGAGLAGAVVLVDHDGVAHRLHVDVGEPDLGDRPVPALPRLDPDPVVRVLYH